jgi:AhpD family alkylhydroperoxidase
MKLDERTTRLIGIGASVAANCQPCLQINISQALKNGADYDDIAEAIEVGKMVRRGTGSKMDDFIAGLTAAASSAVNVSEAGCGCKSKNDGKQ